MAACEQGVPLLAALLALAASSGSAILFIAFPDRIQALYRRLYERYPIGRRWTFAQQYELLTNSRRTWALRALGAFFVPAVAASARMFQCAVS
jgi:hypothetical protein